MSPSSPKSSQGDRQSPPSKQRLPFEPKNQKKPRSAPKTPPAAAKQRPDLPAKPAAPMPEVVSRRMARRMAFFCGLPTLLGLLTFPSFYVIVTQEWLEVPNVVVVLMSMGFFGLGALGLTYGVLSASWDEERSGTRWGWGEFQTNLGRLTATWRSRSDSDKNS